MAAALWFPALGIAGGGVAALQTADPSCADDSGDIYVDCGNGTVTDNRTGLVWLARANCLTSVDWHDAMKFVAGLADVPDTSIAALYDCGLSDNSSPGEWRLPSLAELEDMFADARSIFCVNPAITDDEGTSCWSFECFTSGSCAFSGVQSTLYWSSTSSTMSPSEAWAGGASGFVDMPGVSKTNGALSIWPVRDGQ